jgi:hypothetical protein
MLKGCAKAGLLDGGGSISGRESGGNLRREYGREVILTEGLEVVMVSLSAENIVDTRLTRLRYPLDGHLVHKGQGRAHREAGCVSTRESTEKWWQVVRQVYFCWSPTLPVEKSCATRHCDGALCGLSHTTLVTEVCSDCRYSLAKVPYNSDLSHPRLRMLLISVLKPAQAFIIILNNTSRS